MEELIKKFLANGKQLRKDIVKQFGQVGQQALETMIRTSQVVEEGDWIVLPPSPPESRVGRGAALPPSTPVF